MPIRKPSISFDPPLVPSSTRRHIVDTTTCAATTTVAACTAAAARVASELSQPRSQESPTLQLSKQMKQQASRRRLSSPTKSPQNVSWVEPSAQLLLMADAARERLNLLAKAPMPTGTALNANLYALFLFAQPLVALVPQSCFRGYYGELARVGGDGRVRLLLKIAKMDEDGDGAISGDELRHLDKLVDTTCLSLTNFAVVGSLLFTPNFLAIMDRGKWQPAAEAQLFLGDAAPTILMWVAYVLVCFIATICLTVVVYSVSSKYLLVYVHSTLEAKLCLLCELNPVGVCSRAFICVANLLLLLLPIGGMLGTGSGKWGLAALGVLPVALKLFDPVIVQFRNGTLALHHELMDFIERTAPMDDVESGLGLKRGLTRGSHSLSTKDLWAAAQGTAGSQVGGPSGVRRWTSKRWPGSAPSFGAAWAATSAAASACDAAASGGDSTVEPVLPAPLTSVAMDSAGPSTSAWIGREGGRHRASGQTKRDEP